MASTSASTPDSITYFKLIGAVRNDSSKDIIEFYQYKDIIWYSAAQSVSLGTSNAFAEVDVDAVFPSIVTLGHVNIKTEGNVKTTYLNLYKFYQFLISHFFQK